MLVAVVDFLAATVVMLVFRSCSCSNRSKLSCSNTPFVWILLNNLDLFFINEFNKALTFNTETLDCLTFKHSCCYMSLAQCFPFNCCSRSSWYLIDRPLYPQHTQNIDTKWRVIFTSDSDLVSDLVIFFREALCFCSNLPRLNTRSLQP